ncbi:hypothetical protein N7528_009666 [Penicillium herquei]|nr:hypothetical protein N7528_009666 [Penicillium herquei]
MVMVGDPKLTDANREEWPSLVRKFLLLSSKKIPREICSQQALYCLKAISDRFEEITMYSRLFDISSSSLKSKSFFRRDETQYEGCVCDGSVTVRKWTTADLDEDLSGDEGEQKKCVFHPRSKYRRKLDMIAANKWEPRPSITQTDIRPVESLEEHHFLSEPRSIPSEVLPLLDDSVSSHPTVDYESHSTISSEDSTIEIQVESSVESNEPEEIDGENTRCSTPNKDKMPENISRRITDPKATGSEAISGVNYDTNDRDDEIKEDTLGRASGRPLPLQIRLPDLLPNFCGREGILESLRSYFSPEEETGQQVTKLREQKAAILTGTLGIGKTAVAREYVRRHGLQFSSVMWVQASHRQSIAQSFHEIAFALNLIEGHKEHSHAQSRARLTEWLTETKSDWLLIFDDADVIDSVITYLPCCDHGNVLITSRSADSSLLPGSSLTEFQVTPFSEEEEVELVHAITGLSQEEIKDLGLVNLFGGNPLSLTTVIAGAIQTGSQFRTKNDLRDGFVKGLNDITSAISRLKQHQIPLQTTGLLGSCVEMAQLRPEAKSFCSVMSYLDPYDTPESTLLQAQRFSPMIKSFPITDESFENAKFESVRHGLCVQSSRTSLRMHRAIQSAVREYLISTQQQENAFTTAVQLLLAQWPSRRKFKNVVFGYWPEFSRIHTQLHRLSEVAASTLTEPEHYAPLIKLILQCAWYNSQVLNNPEEDVELLDMAHEVLAISRKGKGLPAMKTQWHSQTPQRLVHINKQTSGWRVIETEGKAVDYIALSYSWSDHSIQMKLTKSTLGPCGDWGRMADMPLLYRDACSIATSLGIRYLWIDRLCVVQDDPADREAELSKIAEIYLNASATITRKHVSAMSMKPRFTSECKLVFEPYSVLCHRCDSNRTRATSPRLAVLAKTVPHFLKDHNPGLIELGLGSKPFNLEIISLEVTTREDQQPSENTEEHDEELAFTEDSSFEDQGSIHTTLQRANEVGKDEPLFYEGSETMTSESEDSTASQGKIAIETGPVVLKSGPDNPETPAADHRMSVTDTSLDEVIATENTAVRDGIKAYEQGNSLDAIAEIVRARDRISAFREKSTKAITSYIVFTTYLALIFLEQGCAQGAINLLSESKKIYGNEVRAAYDVDCCSIGRLHLAWGDAQFAISNYHEARLSYTTALMVLGHDEIDPELQTIEQADIIALTLLKMANLYAREGQFKDAK